jgi:hypothetical protein
MFAAPTGLAFAREDDVLRCVRAAIANAAIGQHANRRVKSACHATQRFHECGWLVLRGKNLRAVGVGSTFAMGFSGGLGRARDGLDAGSLLWRRTAHIVPIDARNTFQEIPGVVMVHHPLAHTRLPTLWDKELSGPSVLRNHQKQALVAFAPSTLAVGSPHLRLRTRSVPRITPRWLSTWVNRDRACRSVAAILDRGITFLLSAITCLVADTPRLSSP